MECLGLGSLKFGLRNLDMCKLTLGTATASSRDKVPTRVLLCVSGHGDTLILIGVGQDGAIFGWSRWTRQCLRWGGLRFGTAIPPRIAPSGLAIATLVTIG